MRTPHKNPRLLAASFVVLACAACAGRHEATISPESRSTTSDLAFVPDFPGAGESGADEPLPDGRVCDSRTSADARPQKPATRCFYQAGQPEPAATIEQVLECAEGLDAVHLRLTFDPAFVDNTYGEFAIGWGERNGPGMPGIPPASPPPAMPPRAQPPAADPMGMGPMDTGKMGMAPMGNVKMAKAMMPGKSGHTWKDLVGSDHAEFVVTNESGELVAQFKLDYVSESAAAPSGYGSLGVLGGDGKMIVGRAADIVRWSTSIDRNLNERGYADYIVDSPETDADYTPNADTTKWDYRVVYEVWIDDDAFGSSGFGDAAIEHVHASPSKAASNTIVVTPGDCPCRQEGGCGQTPPTEPPPEVCTPAHPDDFHCADGEVPPPTEVPEPEPSCADMPEAPECVLL